MADRQTDKATNWAVTAYGEDILRLEDASGYPAYVKKVHGGREVCPTTNREHFQGHIQCAAQQRLSALKKWLPTAHLEVARNVQASIQYSLKSDTASGEKKTVTNPTPFVTNRMAMEKLVAKCSQLCACTYLNTPPQRPDGSLWMVECHIDDKEDYWHRVRAILLDEPDLCGMYAKPDLYRLWCHTKSVWFKRKQLEKSLDSITQGFIVSETNEVIISPESITNATQVSAQAQGPGRKESLQEEGSGTEAYGWQEGCP